MADIPFAGRTGIRKAFSCWYCGRLCWPWWLTCRPCWRVFQAEGFPERV
jgi:hypothetical protein